MTDRRRQLARTRKPPDTRDDQALADAVIRAQAGDENAFILIYRATQPRLLNYLRGTVGETDAEDVAAETWISIIRSLHTFEATATVFHAWTATIAHHRATDHLRRQRPVVPLPHDQLPHQPTHRGTVDQVEEILGTETALALIRGLPPDQAQAILLRVIMGLDAATAADILGKRPGAVRTAAHRGLRTLSRQLSPSTNTEPPKHADQRVAAHNGTVADAVPARGVILKPANRPG
jgi:RNA polymerase sigma-70 factor (ECF subfamily)